MARTVPGAPWPIRNFLVGHPPKPHDAVRVLGGQGKDDVFTITKSGELQVPRDASLLWGGGSVDRILNEEADLLGNAILTSGREAGYDEVAAMLPPALQGGAECSDYNFCTDPGPRARTHAPPRARWDQRLRRPIAAPSEARNATLLTPPVVDNILSGSWACCLLPFSWQMAKRSSDRVSRRRSGASPRPGT